jgi:hypothetical protein
VIRRTLLALGLFASLALSTPASFAADDAPVGHMVFFTLKDRTPANRDALVAGCKKYLGGHEGTLYFSVGTRGTEFNRDVNATDWDVALHLVFKNKAAHDKYQDAPRHLKFIDENKSLWGKVAVYDSYLAPESK